MNIDKNAFTAFECSLLEQDHSNLTNAIVGFITDGEDSDYNNLDITGTLKANFLSDAEVPPDPGTDLRCVDYVFKMHMLMLLDELRSITAERIKDNRFAMQRAVFTFLRWFELIDYGEHVNLGKHAERVQNVKHVVEGKDAKAQAKYMSLRTLCMQLNSSLLINAQCFGAYLPWYREAIVTTGDLH